MVFWFPLLLTFVAGEEVVDCDGDGGDDGASKGVEEGIGGIEGGGSGGGGNGDGEEMFGVCPIMDGRGTNGCEWSTYSALTATEE